MATTLKSILERVVDQLGEEDFTAWTLQGLVRYINDGQKAIHVHRPDLFNTEADLVLVAGHRQTLPALGSKLIAINYNSIGKQGSITKVDRNLLDMHMRDWRNQRPSLDIEHFMYDVRQPKVFEVYPPAKVGAVVRIEYAAIPAEIPIPASDVTLESLSGSVMVNVPDLQSIPLYYFCLFSAYGEDKEEAHSARSAAYRQLFATELGIEFQATEAVAPTSTTP